MIENIPTEYLDDIMDALPFEISFIDENENVRYFNKEGRREIFHRDKSVIGRSVQKCHPPKSLPVVNRILYEFRSGKRDVAEFWIDYKGRKIYIRYFAVRSRKGEYRGCIEVTQDITEIQKISGERRLLDVSRV